MKFKVGDKVRVKKWEDLELEYKVDGDGYIHHDGVAFNPKMKEYCGKELVIEYIGMDEYLCYNGWIWQDWMFEDIETKTIRIDENQEIKIVRNHEATIINLNDLNTTKSRQIERLIKFIAKDYSITNDLDYDLIRETLLKDIRDEDLVNAIMYHVRKGK